MHLLPLTAEKKTKRMEDNTTYSYKEQFPKKSITEIKTTNTTQGSSTKKLTTIMKHGQPSHITVHRYAKLLTYSKTPT
jgi:hypothetical protein